MTFLVQTLPFFDQLPVQIFKWIIIDQITRNKIQERIKQIMALHTQTQKSICNYLWFKTFKLVLLESACSFLQLYSNNNANKSKVGHCKAHVFKKYVFVIIRIQKSNDVMKFCLDLFINILCYVFYTNIKRYR